MDESGLIGVETDNYQTPLKLAGSGDNTPAVMQGKSFILKDGTKVTVPSIGQNQQQAQASTQYTQGVGYQSPQQQSGGEQGKGGSDAAGGVFSDVAAVYNDLRQNQAAVQNNTNSIFNRNLNRKNFALNEANMASNLATAGQSRTEQGITFGQGQADRAGSQKMALAAAKGIAAGLTGLQGN